MPRAIWSGSISFGLVNVPVRMFSAVEERTLHFHYVHERDGGRIGYQKVCKLEDEPVPDEEVVKAFERDGGSLVYLEDEDFEAAAIDSAHTIAIHRFVRYEEIDPVYFERTYYLAPQSGAESVYALLARTMESSGLVGVAMLVMREREYLACLRPRDRVIALSRMYFADEVRPAGKLAPEGTRVGKRELEMASQLVKSFTGPFKPEEFEDTYRQALLKIIKAKAEGRTIEAPKPTKPEEPPDLMDALRASLDAARKQRSSGRRTSGKPRSTRRAKQKKAA